MAGCTTDGGWGVELIDAARARLGDIEAALAAVSRRASAIVDETDWRSDAVAAYRRRASAWEAAVRDVAREVDRVRDDLANTRRDLVARSGWERG
ncbi:MAG: hypothetical protein J0I70_04390 [Microbacterium sp.]|uniref:hypothetical protein n=1 Tax=Microbacterium sp. TaxID=51671 RepID=UPI001AC1846B|nr:hypothetical protein [Microbacterium sp.]MBN9173377.1 hypothetical protein [Microbacterium sp.]MBN9180447.1 hypothetical protein [Microbacterium sp.]